MKSSILLLVSILYVSLASAQTPIDAIFKKYSNRNGVDISIDNISVAGDSATKAALSTTSKTLRIENEDKNVAKLFKKISKDCNKILSRKEYALVSMDKEDNHSLKIFRYHNGAVAEFCELEQVEGELTLTVTQIQGLTPEMQKNIQTKTGIKQLGKK